MPQAGSNGYDPWERAFMDASDLDPEPLLRGIDDYETALKAHRLAHEYDARTKYKEHIAKKLNEYSD